MSNTKPWWSNFPHKYFSSGEGQKSIAYFGRKQAVSNALISCVKDVRLRPCLAIEAFCTNKIFLWINRLLCKKHSTYPGLKFEHFERKSNKHIPCLPWFERMTIMSFSCSAWDEPPLGVVWKLLSSTTNPAKPYRPKEYIVELSSKVFFFSPASILEYIRGQRFI